MKCDVLVVGSGAGGMSAAITARLAGLDVLVIEKEPVFGGSTARSGGNLWIPCSDIALREGVQDSVERALLYVQSEAGPHFDRERATAYLTAAPAMIRTFSERTSALRFVRTDAVGDNHAHLPGALEEGRTLTTPPFDGQRLGEHLKALAAPLPELTFLGMQIQPGRELEHFFKAFRSAKSLAFVLRRLSAHGWDLLRHGRTTQLKNGNGLAARLMKSALDLGVRVQLMTAAHKIIRDEERVRGALVARSGRLEQIEATRGVVLAAGGFPHDSARRRRLVRIPGLDVAALSLAPKSNVGDGLRLAEEVGGAVEAGLPNAISWTPVSRVPQPRGDVGLFPHGFDRSRPGVIAVTRHGLRFSNEAAVGNDFIRAMAKACGSAPMEGFLIADRRTVRRYGLGIARPGFGSHRGLIRRGYLLRGATLEALARSAGIDAGALQDCVRQFNSDARRGVDSQFHRGETALERRNGDPALRPNPCVAPLVDPPFYAVRILPGDFSSLSGLRVDAHARVLDAADCPIPGLYASGNDALSMFGGNSAAGGATLGPAMTFGFIAARHLAGEVDAELKASC